MKVSIITSVFNNRKYIEDAINSVLNQTYKNIEYIIIDGKSTDGTVEIINKYIDKIDHFVSESDKGIYDGLNKGIKLASGDIIGFLHSDDVYYDNKVIEKVVKNFNDAINGVYGDLIYISHEGKIIRYWKSGEFSIKKLKLGWMPPHPTLFLKRCIYEKYGLFNENFQISADYEFILRVLYKNSISVKYIPEVLIKMRVGGKSNRNIKSFIKTTIEDYKAWKENDLPGGLIAVAFKKLRKIEQFRF